MNEPSFRSGARTLLLAVALAARCAGAPDLEGAPQEAGAETDPSSVVGPSSSGAAVPSAPACDTTPILRKVAVSSASALSKAIAAALPGDEIRVANGVYSLTSAIPVQKRGNATNHIVIRAATIGGAEITGSAGFNISGAAYVTVCGFRFTYATVPGTPGIGMTILSSNHVRFTRNYLHLADSGLTHWLFIKNSGRGDNRIDHNTFDNKTSEGIFLVVGGPAGTLSQYNVIDHNYFYRQLFPPGDRGECLRVGTGDVQLLSAFARVESNRFEQCNGDGEVISSKSSDNTYRWNTFLNNTGSLVLRAGHRATVEGNFFLPGGNGIRLYGNDNRIINNYFEGTTGTGYLATIVLGSGDVVDASAGYSGYDRPDRAVVAFNTLVNTATNIEIGTGGNAYGPADCLIANNLIQGDGHVVARELVAPTGFTWEGNLLWGTNAPGIMPASGYVSADPLLVQRPNDVFRIGAGSAAIDAAVGALPFVTADMDGDARSGALDVGADEFSTAVPVRHPLSPSEVGPAAP